MKTTTQRVFAVLLACAMLFSLALGGCSSSMDLDSTASTAPGDGGAYSSEAAPVGPGIGGGYDYSYEGEQYLDIIETGEHYTAEEPEIALSLKVDTAAYTNVKRYLESGQLPPFNSVRTEELINYFDYDMPLEFDGESPFAVYTELGPSPLNENKQLAFVRVKTEDIDKEQLPPSNLVFLIDTSGSMNSYDKLPLLQNAFAQLVETLDQGDRVSLVTYAGSSSVVLSGASGADKPRINAAIHDLMAGGSTAGAEGIQTAYDLASEYFIEGGNNRVILATDGDFNVGISSTDQLERFISEKRDSGIFLSVLGFGTGNIRDDIMETLATNGNGNYSYIDSQQTAKKVLVNELGSNLFTVANDVKAKLVFDTEAVASYRLIGYENRTMSSEEFDDDNKDAGEIGVGSDVVVLLELELIDAERTPFEVNIRYKNPDQSESQLLSLPASPLSATAVNSTDFGFASSVALFGEMLRNPAEATRSQMVSVQSLAQENRGEDREGYREDYLRLLKQFSDVLSIQSAETF